MIDNYSEHADKLRRLPLAKLLPPIVFGLQDQRGRTRSGRC